MADAQNHRMLQMCSSSQCSLAQSPDPGDAEGSLPSLEHFHRKFLGVGEDFFEADSFKIFQVRPTSTGRW